MTLAKSKANRSSVWSLLVISLAVLMAVGCTETSTSSSTSSGEEEHHHHDHGHRPKSYHAALTKVKHARDEVKAAFDAGTPNACDDALHEVSEVLDVLPEVAAETDLPKEDWQVVKDQSKVLFDRFMEIHDGFHGGDKQGASFDSVADEINKAIEVLESKVAATGEKVPAEHEHDHAHEGHDHDEDHDEDHDHSHDDHGHEGHEH